MKEKRSITRTNLLSWITTILIVSVSFTVFFVYEKYMDFEGTKEVLHESHLKYSKRNLKSSISDMLKFIHYQYSLIDKEAREDTDAAAKMRESVVKKLRAIGFGTGNLFILDSDGNILMHSGDESRENRNLRDWTDRDGKKPYQQLMVSAELKGLGEVTFSGRGQAAGTSGGTILMAKPFNEWGWFVCGEVDLASVRRAVIQNEQALRIDLVVELIYIFLLVVIITLIALRLSYSVSKSIKKEIGLLLNYFEKSPTTDAAPLSESEFQFNEFSFIAKSATAMVEKINSLITRIKEMAITAEASNQSKSAFLASINYGIRSPISGIMGMSQILSDTELNEKQRHYVESITSSGRKIVELINDVQNFSSIEAGLLNINSEPFDLRAACDDVITPMMVKAEENGLELALDVDDNVPRYLEGDHAKIAQILTHLVGNAIQFTSEGTVNVRISCPSRKNDKAVVEFSVTDTGVGISEDDLNLVFSFADRDFVPTSYKFSVVSLGLAVCKHMVEQMGGEINATSEKEKGSTFFFKVPLAVADEAALPAKPSKKETAEERPEEKTDKKPVKEKQLRILLAEDDPVNRSVAEIFLKKAGHKVVSTVNGRDALDKYSKDTFDIVFMDCEMPEMDGYAATMEIRKMEKEGEHIPVIALTAHSLEADHQRGMEAGMDDYLTKPFASIMLKKIIAKHFP